MLKEKIIASAVALGLLTLLFTLPRVVVSNESGGLATEQTSSESSSSSSLATDNHTDNISETDRQKIIELRDRLKNSTGKENFINFATSLSEAYRVASIYDSAAFFMAQTAAMKQSAEQYRRTADLYYEAYTFALDAGKESKMGLRARTYYDSVLVLNPSDLDSKAKQAMTYLSGDNPMQGIFQLREIIQENPKHQLTLYNLGLLSLQSGQYEKAVTRFEKLVRLYPENIEGQFYLGVAYLESGSREKGVEQLEKTRSLTNDPGIQSAVAEYLNNA
jgi:outer membrane protein